MNLNEDSYKVLHDVQKKCNELNQKIDSIVQMMEIFTTYMQYSSMMSDFDLAKAGKPMSEGGDSMNPKDLQKMMNMARQSDPQMSQDEFGAVFETLKQGKSAEEVARMEQMVQMAKSFMK